MKYILDYGNTLLNSSLCALAIFLLTSAASAQLEWGPQKQISSDGAAVADSSVHLKADDNGTIIAAWRAKNSEEASAIKVARSLNYGLSFEPAIQLTPFVGNASFAFPQVVHNGGSQWSIFYVSNWLKYVSRSFDNGVSWTPPQETAPYGKHFRHQVASNSLGTILALIFQPDVEGNYTENGQGTAILRSTNNGESFTTSTVLPMPYVSRIVHTGSDNWVAQHDDGTVRLSADNGQTWTPAQSSHGLNPSNNLIIVSDGHGTVIATETVYTYDDPDRILTYNVSTSHDSGNTWSNKTSVFSHSETYPSSPTWHEGHATPLYLKSGQWALAMTSHLSHFSSYYLNLFSISSKVYFSMSSDGGVTWSSAEETAPDNDPLTASNVKFYASRNYLLGCWWEVNFPDPNGDILYKRAFVPSAGPTAAVDWQLFE